MGFDTSFHPVPHVMIAERLVPWLLGVGTLDDLVDDAVRITTVRFTANAWGLGATRADCERFEPFLHVFGRPFLVTADTVGARAEQIDAFLACAPSDGDDLARAHLDLLEPGLAASVDKATDGSLPPPDVLRTLLTSHMDLMRSTIEAVQNGVPSVSIGGESHDAAPLLGRELARVVLDFAATFRPGWMSRGPTWPTHVLHDHAVRDHFLPSFALIQPVLEALPDVPWMEADSIEENYMVGGCLPADRVSEVLDALDPEDDLERRKLREALQDALHRGLPFAEATEVYSGPAGTLN